MNTKTADAELINQCDEFVRQVMDVIVEPKGLMASSITRMG